MLPSECKTCLLIAVLILFALWAALLGLLVPALILLVAVLALLVAERLFSRG
jgi:hypothetical protein